MDVAKEYITGGQCTEDCFAVIASEQTAGRGTQGRVWSSTSGNLFLTFAVKMAAIRTPLQLTPLRVGVLLRNTVASFTANPGDIELKWPNDVLIGKKKVSGILIEVQDDYALVGVGCNIGSAPTVESTGPDCGRPATCLLDHVAVDARDTAATDLIQTVGTDLCRSIYAWVETSGGDSARAIVSDFSQAMDTTKQRMRPESGGIAEVVTPVRVKPDGTLEVKTGTGASKILVSEYLF